MSGLALISLDSAQPAGSGSPPAPPRLVSAAHEFEAAMMKELIAPLEAGHDSLSGDDSEDGSSSALGSFAAEALGKAISEHGGLGIATSILHELTHNGRLSGKATVPEQVNPSNPKSPSV